MPEGPRYTFHPLERRGLLLGLDATQLATIGGSVVLAVAAHAVVGGPLGIFLGLTVAAAGLTATLWTRAGSSLGALAVLRLTWVIRRPRRRIDDEPTGGVLLRLPLQPGLETKPHYLPTVTGGRPARTTRPAGIELIAAPGSPGEAALGVVRDRRSGCWAAVVPVGGCSFSLLDPAEQGHRLEGWRRVLGSLARPGSPVARVQWVQRSWTGSGWNPAESSDESSPRELHASADASYREMSRSADSAMIRHQGWVVLAIRSPHRPRAGVGAAPGAMTVLRRELRLLCGQLRDAALDPLEPMGLARLEAMIAGPTASPRATEDGAGMAWPLASIDGWSAYRADGLWHATYWIAEWPRVDVGPDFLTPLLVGSVRNTVSVVMAPVPPDKAMREVRSARTADLADAELKARAGFLQSARRERESAGVNRREAELADGHQDFRFSGYVTVSAQDPEALTAACAATEHSAQSARLELRRLYGRQAEAYTWTLPLARGLR